MRTLLRIERHERKAVAWAGPLPDGLCPGNAIVGRLLDVRP